jgi:glycosyltransferase involved in cell wall biosynthesis
MDLYSQKLAKNLEVPKLYSNIYQKAARLFGLSPFSWQAMKAFGEGYHFVRRLNRGKSIIHLPNQHLGRYGLSLKTPYIITVHDLIRYFDLKGYSPFIHRLNIRDKFWLSRDYRGIKKAIKIIAVSRWTKQDLVQYLEIPKENISVIYEGIDHELFKPVRNRPVNYPYILFVGTEYPRKNFIGLLKAFSRLKGERKFRDLKLIKVGRAGGLEGEFRKQTLKAIKELGLSNDVVFTEYVAEEDLPAYYSGAECFILPSYYEGFGFPALEAMACGCPVIVSNRSSLPEITGGAAIKVDPDDVEGLAIALQEVITNEESKQNLIDKGLKRAGEFSWQMTASETLNLYREVEKGLISG